MTNTIDIETYKDGSNVIPYCICISIKGNFYSFYGEEVYNIVDLLNIIYLKDEMDYIEIFCHNLNFDGFIIIDLLSKKKIKFEIKSIQTDLFYIKIFFLTKIIILRCSYKIIPLSLRILGEMENFEKTYFPYKFVNKDSLYYIGDIPDRDYWNENDLDLFKIKNKPPFDLKKETIKYCINDLNLLNKILDNIIKIINSFSKYLLNKSFSAPSISHNLFFLNYNIKNIPKTIKKKDEDFIRFSYFGGRCEVFGNPNNNEIIKYFDFSGMYGQCMMESFHIGDGYYTIPNSIEKPGFYSINYISNNMDIPVLPNKSFENKLLFKNGRSSGIYWYEEILYFIEKGGILDKINHAYIFDKSDFVFQDFVKEFTKIREKGIYYKFFGKLMINSLYGSMALNEITTTNIITFSEEEVEFAYKNLNVLKFYKINNIFIIEIKIDEKLKKYNIKYEKNKSSRNVSYSSAISSKARIKLHRAMMEVIEDGGRLLYCDTDSIFASYDKNDKREYFYNNKWLDFYDDGVFAAPKSYALKGKKDIIKIKGVSVNDLTYEDFKKDFYNNKSIKMNNQLNFNKKDFTLKQDYINKEILRKEYNKRIFINNKKETRPFNIDDPGI